MCVCFFFPDPDSVGFFLSRCLAFWAQCPTSCVYVLICDLAFCFPGIHFVLSWACVLVSEPVCWCLSLCVAFWAHVMLSDPAPFFLIRECLALRASVLHSESTICFLPSTLLSGPAFNFWTCGLCQGLHLISEAMSNSLDLCLIFGRCVLLCGPGVLLCESVLCFLHLHPALWSCVLLLGPACLLHSEPGSACWAGVLPIEVTPVFLSLQCVFESASYFLSLSLAFQVCS